jgi:hypothetical protein
MLSDNSRVAAASLGGSGVPLSLSSDQLPLSDIIFLARLHVPHQNPKEEGGGKRSRRDVLHLLVRVLHMVISNTSHLSLLQVLSLFLIYQLLHLHSLLFLSLSLPQLLVCPPHLLECLDALAAFRRPLATGGSSNSPTWLPETQMTTTRLLSLLIMTFVKLSLLELSLRLILTPTG